MVLQATFGRKKNYGITELECQAVVYALSKLSSFTLGVGLTILVDLTALKVLNAGTPVKV